MTRPSSLSSQIFKFFPGVPLSLFGGAKPFNSGNGWYKSLYPSFLIPHSAQLLLSRRHSHLSLMFPPPPKSQAFMWLDTASLCFKIFTYSKFLQCLRGALHAVGLPASDYPCHSFRWGGESFAFQAGLPVKVIKILGDWHSNAVLLYLTVPLSVRLESINVIAKVILSFH